CPGIDAAAVCRRTRLFLRDLAQAALCRSRNRGPVRAGQPRAFGGPRRGARTASADRPKRPSQAGPRDSWFGLGRRRGYPTWLADLWSLCRCRAVGGELAAAVDPGGAIAWLLYARAEYRGDLQGDCAMGSASGARRDLERSDAACSVATDGGRRDPFR